MPVLPCWGYNAVCHTVQKWYALQPVAMGRPEESTLGYPVSAGRGTKPRRAVQANGVTEFIGAQASDLSFLPMFLILLAIVGAVVFLTELTSNTATTATLIPVLAAIAPALNIHPYTLVIRHPSRQVVRSCCRLQHRRTRSSSVRDTSHPGRCAAPVSG